VFKCAIAQKLKCSSRSDGCSSEAASTAFCAER
jgi:hypothetical protein